MNLNDIKQRLPTIPGINGRDEYFNSVVLLLLVPVNGEFHIVFEKRAANIPQAGEICLPGGKRENNESLQTTAVRETEEELGIPSHKITILGNLDTLIAPLGVIVDVIVGYTEVDLSTIKINEAEVTRCFTVPLSFFQHTQPEEYKVMIKVHPTYIDEATKQEVVLLPWQELGVPEKYASPWGKLNNQIYVYKAEGEVIWGITARIVRDFIQKIRPLKGLSKK
ncbi:MAG: CoA pyrophosphatase [Paludibacteraceae bacterium]|nr:CoA pyrophosphatase [Paludibacteraceae bacterium]MBN2788023.1 CoA pyrophosphatase [Paludibacteraceae bacterium]